MNLCIGILEDEEICIEQITTQLNTWKHTTNHTIELHIFRTEKEIKNPSIDYNMFHFFILDIMLYENAEAGLDIAKQLRHRGFKNDLIFLTSFREYVFEGYNVNAFNFLVKPIDDQKLTFVLNALATKYSGQFYTFRQGGTIHSIPYSDILSFASNNHETSITTLDTVYIDHSTLHSIASHLPAFFLQCHRSCIVNIYHIKKIQNNSIYLTNNTTQTISRKYISTIKNSYMNFITTGGFYI